MGNLNSKKYVKDLEVKLKFYEKIFDKIPVVIYINDVKNAKLHWINFGFGNVLDYTIEECMQMGNSFYSGTFHPEDLALLANSMMIFNKEDGPLTGVYRVLDKEKTWKKIFGVAVVMSRDDDGYPEYTLGVAFDIEQKMFTEKGLETMVKENHQLRNQIKLKSLTKREKEIIILVAKGLKCNEIADRFSISFHTVNTHRKNILKKLNLKNMQELSAFAVENGLN